MSFWNFLEGKLFLILLFLTKTFFSSRVGKNAIFPVRSIFFQKWPVFIPHSKFFLEEKKFFVTIFFEFLKIVKKKLSREIMLGIHLL